MFSFSLPWRQRNQRPRDPPDGSWTTTDIDACRRLAVELTRWNHPAVRTLGPNERHIVGEMLATAVNAAHPRRKLPRAAVGTVEALERDGIARLGQLLTPQQCADIEAYFRARPCYNLHYEGHIKGDRVGRRVDGDAAKFSFGSYSRDEIVTAPHLLDTLAGDTVLDVVEGFLGTRPMLFSVNAFWSFPGHAAASYGQDFHRDVSHPRFCVLFVYLTDTTPASGAHQYIRGTHRLERVREHLRKTHADARAEDLFSLPQDGLGYSEIYDKLFAGEVDTIDGPAGTSFIEDTYGLHRGLTPNEAPRLAAWARYSLFPAPPQLERSPRALLGDRYPADERRQYALRGVID